MVCGQHVPVDASAPAVQLRAFPSESQATWRRDAHSAPGAGNSASPAGNVGCPDSSLEDCPTVTEE